nr:hypothetical protein [Nitrosomonas nitrosa]
MEFTSIDAAKNRIKALVLDNPAVPAEHIHAALAERGCCMRFGRVRAIADEFLNDLAVLKALGALDIAVPGVRPARLPTLPHKRLRY